MSNYLICLNGHLLYRNNKLLYKDQAVNPDPDTPTLQLPTITLNVNGSEILQNGVGDYYNGATVDDYIGHIQSNANSNYPNIITDNYDGGFINDCFDDSEIRNRVYTIFDVIVNANIKNGHIMSINTVNSVSPQTVTTKMQFTAEQLYFDHYFGEILSSVYQDVYNNIQENLSTLRNS